MAWRCRNCHQDICQCRQREHLRQKIQKAAEAAVDEVYRQSTFMALAQEFAEIEALERMYEL